MSADTWQLASAYALGTLDAEEAAEFERRLLIDAELRAEVARFQAVVAELPLLVDPVPPPPAVKSALMAKIEQPVQTTPAVVTPAGFWSFLRGWSLFPHGALVGAVFAIALLGGALFTTNAQLQQAKGQVAQLAEQADSANQLVAQFQREQETLRADLAAAQQSNQQLATDLAAAQQNNQQLVADLEARTQRLQQIESQIQNNEQTLTFLAARDLATRPLSGDATDAEGTMFMRPGNTEAVVLVRNLPTLDQSRTYQFWLAQGMEQVNAGVLTIDADGTGRLVFNAPVPVDRFVEVMVTVEQTELAPAPSEDVVLAGRLT